MREECVIGGRAFTFDADVRDGDLRHSFDALARRTFGLSFESWYAGGYWIDSYRPYTLSRAGEVVSSASASVMRAVWRGEERIYVQIGAVMTAPEYRNMGLSTYLMNRIIEDWRDRCDGVYLYANDSVRGFYPRFGFTRAGEWRARIEVEPRNSPVRRLSMTRAADAEIFRRCYHMSNPFSELTIIDNWGLIMFYCASDMSDCVYYLEDFDAVIIAGCVRGAPTVYDIFCGGGASLYDILGAFASGASGEIGLGFALKNAPPGSLRPLEEEDTTLFVLGGVGNVFDRHRTMFPLLSHT